LWVDDRQRLSGYVSLWWGAVGSFVEVLEALSPEDWAKPTDLPGWDVHACAAHTAHLEAILSGAPEETLSFEPPDHATTLMSIYTEQGVVARRHRSPAELVEEIRSATTARHQRLLDDPPTDGGGRPDPIFGGVGWDWETLLRNRPLDVWMHEQDVRRAVRRPGGMDSPAAAHVVDYLSESLGYVLAKRAAAPAGTTLVLRVDEHAPRAFVVGDSGRGAATADIPEEPTVCLAMDREAFVLLAGGRREPAPGSVRVDGDGELGQRVLDRLAVTP
jgi:uncharacterized protein (TIGR03083 family)